MIGLALGTHVLVSGVEDDPSGALRVYVGQRAAGIYALIVDETDKDSLRNAWGSTAHHVTIPKPPADTLYCDRPEIADA